MRFWLALLVAVVGSSISARAVQVVGVGGKTSCATWFSGNKFDDIQVRHWIGGFWSGANALNTTDDGVGSDTDANGIFGEVRLYCSQHPSATLFRASADVYDSMARKRARK